MNGMLCCPNKPKLFKTDCRCLEISTGTYKLQHFLEEKFDLEPHLQQEVIYVFLFVPCSPLGTPFYNWGA